MHVQQNISLRLNPRTCRQEHTCTYTSKVAKTKSLSSSEDELDVDAGGGGRVGGGVAGCLATLGCGVVAAEARAFMRWMISA
jgi:hypothetical protein